jgi:hypothetical protein
MKAMTDEEEEAAFEEVERVITIAAQRRGVTYGAMLDLIDQQLRRRALIDAAREPSITVVCRTADYPDVEAAGPDLPIYGANCSRCRAAVFVHNDRRCTGPFVCERCAGAATTAP